MLQRSAAIARNELRLLRRDPSPLVILLAMPLLVMPILRTTVEASLRAAGHARVSGAQFVVPGQTVMFVFFVPGTLGFSFFREHGWHTWDRVRANGVGALDLIVGKAVPMLGLAGAQTLVVFGVGFLLLDFRVRGSVLGVAAIAAALAVCVVALGLAVTALARTAQQLNSVAYLGAVGLGALGGAMVPVRTLPAWARHVAPATPQYWAMRGFDAIVLDGRGAGAALVPVVALLAFAAAGLLVAAFRLRLTDTKISFA